MQNIIDELTEKRKDQQHKYKAIDELLKFGTYYKDVRLASLDSIKESGAVITSELMVSEILFSPRKIRSIIHSLLSNAIKFKSLKRKPEIFIRTIKEITS